jgi:hypothetical protein
LHEGKARAIGVSDYPIDQLEEILWNSDVVPAVNGRISTISIAGGFITFLREEQDLAGSLQTAAHR